MQALGPGRGAGAAAAASTGGASGSGAFSSPTKVKIASSPSPVGVDHHDLTGAQLAEEDLLREHVLDLALDRAAQRPGTQDRVVAPLGEQVLGRAGELDAHVLVAQPLVELGDHQVDDRDDLVLRSAGGTR